MGSASLCMLVGKDTRISSGNEGKNQSSTAQQSAPTPSGSPLLSRQQWHNETENMAQVEDFNADRAAEPSCG